MPRGQDVMISVYNIHHSPAVWDNPEAFDPERFGPLDGPVPNEQNTDYRYAVVLAYTAECASHHPLGTFPSRVVRASVWATSLR